METILISSEPVFKLAENMSSLFPLSGKVTLTPGVSSPLKLMWLVIEASQCVSLCLGAHAHSGIR